MKEEELGINYTRNYIKENFLTGSTETDHFVIYYKQGTPEANNIKLIADDHEWRYKELKEFLEVNPRGKIRSYIYPDKDTRKRLIGAGETTIANPIQGEIHLVYDIFPDPLLKHELTHVMSSEFGMKVLRVSPKVGLIEGLAVAADWNGERYTPHQWAEAMIRTDSAPEVKDVIGLGFFQAPPSKGYTVMGSFVRYLVDTYGIENFKNVYRTGSFSVYGKGIDELISEWREFLGGIHIPDKLLALAHYRFSQPSIFQGKCPRRIAALTDKGFRAFEDGNFYEAKKCFIEASGLKSRDPIIIEGLAYTYYFDRNYNELIDLINRSQAIPDVQKNILENLRGNALWQLGKVKDAKSIFESLLEKPLPEDVRREVEIKLTAISAGGETERKIREYFGTRDKLYQAVILGEVIKDFPDYAPAYYLLGRLFYKNKDFKKAASFLLESESIGLPTESIEIENLRLLGVSLFAAGDYDGAIRSFQSILNLESNEVPREYAIDFIERCESARSRR
jgi:tetratricopeptide (TPR) repeat protein